MGILTAGATAAGGLKAWDRIHDQGLQNRTADQRDQQLSINERTSKRAERADRRSAETHGISTKANKLKLKKANSAHADQTKIDAFKNLLNGKPSTAIRLWNSVAEEGERVKPGSLGLDNKGNVVGVGEDGREFTVPVPKFGQSLKVQPIRGKDGSWDLVPAGEHRKTQQEITAAELKHTRGKELARIKSGGKGSGKNSNQVIKTVKDKDGNEKLYLINKSTGETQELDLGLAEYDNNLRSDSDEQAEKEIRHDMGLKDYIPFVEPSPKEIRERGGEIYSEEMKRRDMTPNSGGVSDMVLRPDETGISQQPQQQEAPPGAIEYLRKNPGVAAQFKAKYGFLPEGF